MSLFVHIHPPSVLSARLETTGQVLRKRILVGFANPVKSNRFDCRSITSTEGS